MKKAEQNIFDFSLKPYMGSDNFVVSNCNEAAFKAVENWPNWLYFALCLYGPKGCGKSHLATLFAHKVMMLASKPFAVKVIKSERIKHKKIKINQGKNEMKLLLLNNPWGRNIYNEGIGPYCLENLNENVDNEALFHLYNYYRDNGGNILFLTERAPSHIRFKLPDLASRMRAVPAVAINAPDDEMLRVLLFKLFDDRQVKVAPEVLEYALNNMTRSFEYAQKLVTEADRISLIKKTPVNIAVIREAMELLDDNKQGDFFL